MVNDLSLNSDFDGERNSIHVPENDPFIGFSIFSSVLYSMDHFKRLCASVSDIVDVVECDQSVVGVGSFVHGFVSVPTPLSPDVDLVYKIAVIESDWG